MIYELQITPALECLIKCTDRANSPWRLLALVTLKTAVFIQIAEEVFQFGELLVPCRGCLLQNLRKERGKRSVKIRGPRFMVNWLIRWEPIARIYRRFFWTEEVPRNFSRIESLCSNPKGTGLLRARTNLTPHDSKMAQCRSIRCDGLNSWKEWVFSSWVRRNNVLFIGYSVLWCSLIGLLLANFRNRIWQLVDILLWKFSFECRFVVKEFLDLLGDC